MTPRDTKRINEYYTSALAEYGSADARSVHWTDTIGQYARFRVLAGIIENDDATPTILDVGCGTGELYKFFLTEKIPVNYFGIDVVPELVAVAKNRFPDGHFEVRDIFDMKSDEESQKFDYVLASGALTFKVADNLTYYQSMIEKIYSLARRGIAFNMLNAAVHIDDETYAAYDPRNIAEFCHSFGGQIEIFTDYLPQDFTVYVRKV